MHVQVLLLQLICFLVFPPKEMKCLFFAFRGSVLQRTAREDTQLRALEGEQRDERRQGKGEKEQ